MGINASLGFAKSFSAIYHCRACINPNSETQKLTVEVPDTHRNRMNYAEALDRIEESTTVKLKDTFGINSGCLLNELKYFHVLDNWHFDIMHDLCEGVIPDLLEKFFQHIIKTKISTEHQLQNFISAYDYGVLNRKCLPSDLRLGKANCNQSSSSVKCLMENLPFILFSYKNHSKLTDIWKCATSLLRIMKICYSHTLREVDLINLKEEVDCHLKYVMHCFKEPLKPKQHHLTHYVTSIRNVGPLVHNSSLRFESKHKELKVPVEISLNYQNVPKSVAHAIQMKDVFRTPYVDVIKHSVPYAIDDSFQQFAHFLHAIGCSGEIVQVKTAKINSFSYERGLILKNKQNFEEIHKILMVKEDFYFLCAQYNYLRFDQFLNAIEIEEKMPKQWSLFKQSELEYQRTHNKINLNGSIYVLANSLEVEENLCL